MKRPYLAIKLPDGKRITFMEEGGISESWKRHLLQVIIEEFYGDSLEAR